jgi:hypothetical protein
LSFGVMLAILVVVVLLWQAAENRR